MGIFLIFFLISPTTQIKERGSASCSEISPTNISPECKWRNTECLKRCQGSNFTPIITELLVKPDVLFTWLQNVQDTNLFQSNQFCQKQCCGSEVVACCSTNRIKRMCSRPSVTFNSNRRIIVVCIISGALCFIFLLISILSPLIQNKMSPGNASCCTFSNSSKGLVTHQIPSTHTVPLFLKQEINSLSCHQSQNLQFSGEVVACREEHLRNRALCSRPTAAQVPSPWLPFYVTFYLSEARHILCAVHSAGPITWDCLSRLRLRSKRKLQKMGVSCQHRQNSG